MNRNKKPRDGMLEEYQESLNVTSRGTFATKFMTKTGYVRHAQITTWWKAPYWCLDVSGHPVFSSEVDRLLHIFDVLIFTSISCRSY